MAKKRNTKRKPAGRQASEPRGIPKWLWLLMGIALGVIVAYSGAIFDLIQNKPADQTSQPIVEKTTVSAEAPLKAAPPKEPEVLTLIPPEVPPKYDFYERLPKDEVILPERDYRSVRQPQAPLQDKPRAVTPTPTKPAASSSDNTGKYLIQVGSFRGKKDAERRKADLILKGLRPRVESVTTDSGKWYRVRLGPFGSMDKVNRIRSELHSQKIKTLLVNASGQ